MNRYKIALILLPAVILLSCTARNGKSSDEVSLNITKQDLDQNQNQNQQGTVQNPPGQSGGAEEEGLVVQTRSYLSGRTEFLSLDAGMPYILPRGFDFGDLYCDFYGTEDEKAVITVCRAFFKTLSDDNFPSLYIAEKRKGELKDYWNYFIKDKINFDSVLYGRPLSTGSEEQVDILVQKDNRTGRVFLKKNTDDKWLVTGLEMDLRKDLPDTTETWLPVLRPSLFGY